VPRICLENPISIISSPHSEAGSDHPAVAVWTRGSQGDVSLAEEHPATGADEHRGRSAGSSSPRTART
jgi:hypothetical protein